MSNLPTLNKKTFVVGTRRSKLALCQTHMVVAELKKSFPDVSFEIDEMETKGDQILDVALSKIGDKGLFTQDLEDKLLGNKIDFAVHSLKDLPTQLPDGLIVGCITERVNPNDVVLIRSDLVAKGLTTLKQLNDSDDEAVKIIGSSSLRRQSQILAQYPSLKFKDCRGNLDTRIAKLEDTKNHNYAAIVLASAGLERQGEAYKCRITETLSDMYYAVGQGALGIECRDNDEETLNLLSVLQHGDSSLRCKSERAFLKKLEGGCHAPIAVKTTVDEQQQTKMLTLYGRVLSLDGKEVIEDSITDNALNFHSIGDRLGELLLEKGAGKLINHAN